MEQTEYNRFLALGANDFYDYDPDHQEKTYAENDYEEELRALAIQYYTCKPQRPTEEDKQKLRAPKLQALRLAYLAEVLSSVRDTIRPWLEAQLLSQAAECGEFAELIAQNLDFYQGSSGNLCDFLYNADRFAKLLDIDPDCLEEKNKTIALKLNALNSTQIVDLFILLCNDCLYAQASSSLKHVNFPDGVTPLIELLIPQIGKLCTLDYALDEKIRQDLSELLEQIELNKSDYPELWAGDE